MVTATETGNQLSQREVLRLFVAVTVPPQVQESLERAQATLRSALPSDLAKWTKREQFHLTLRFLGKVDAGRVPELETNVREACYSFKPMTLQATGIGFFPEKRLPRVMWAGLRDRTNQISNLHQAVQAATDTFTSEAAQDDFSAHITLARIKDIQRHEAERLKKAAAGYREVILGEWRAEALELMRSQLSSAGAQHSVVARFLLGGERIG